MPLLPRPLSHPFPGRLVAFTLLLTAAPAPAAPPPPPVPPAAAPRTADDSIYDPPSPKTVYEEQEEDERTDKARTLFRLGVGLIDAGRWAEAYTTLSEAWKLKQHWQVGYQLARAEIVTGHVRGAIEHLGLALTDPDPEAQQTRPKFQALLDQARSKLAYLHIDGSPPGARVLVDGEERGVLPLTEPVAVDPGEREIALRLGERTASTRVVTTSGQTSAARLTLPAPPTAPGPASPPRDRTPMIVGIAGLGAGVVGVLGGAALWTAAQDKRALYEMLRDGPGFAGKDRALEDAAAQANGLATGAAIVWVGAGLLAAGGGGYWLYSSSRSPSPATPTSVTLLPAVSPDHAGFTLNGTW